MVGLHFDVPKAGPSDALLFLTITDYENTFNEAEGYFAVT